MIISCDSWRVLIVGSVDRAFFFSGDLLLLDAEDLVFAVFIEALLLPQGVPSNEKSSASCSLVSACVFIGCCSLGLVGCCDFSGADAVGGVILLAMRCNAVTI